MSAQKQAKQRLQNAAQRAEERRIAAKNLPDLSDQPPPLAEDEFIDFDIEQDPTESKKEWQQERSTYDKQVDDELSTSSKRAVHRAKDTRKKQQLVAQIVNEKNGLATLPTTVQKLITPQHDICTAKDAAQFSSDLLWAYANWCKSVLPQQSYTNTLHMIRTSRHRLIREEEERIREDDGGSYSKKRKLDDE